MKITEVKITGFKSFVDGIVLPIEAGLTGIVGPNGCGKSNVLESMRWVMGATSAKALRGGEMDDVIFAGTDLRPARDIAEVIIKLDNHDRSAPEPYKSAPHIEISRRIRRGMGSTFRINGKEVRARDVQLIFADASSGANSPALVRQGQVAEMINAKPENRRRLLEEAAGIAGLQARRHEAQNKLNATENNLERIGEILIHLDEQIASLKKQAQRAEKYRGLAAHIRGLEMFIALDKQKTMHKSLAEARQSFNEANQMVASFMVELGKANRDLEEAEKLIIPAREEQAIADAVLRRHEAKLIEIERDLKEIIEKSEIAQTNLKRIEKDKEREQELLNDAQNALAKCVLELSNFAASEDFSREIGKLSEIIAIAQIHANEMERELSAAINEKARLEADYINNQRTKERISNEIASLEANEQRLKAELSQKEQSFTSNDEIASLIDAIGKYELEFIAANNEVENLNKSLGEIESLEIQAASAHNNNNNKRNRLKAELDGLNAILNVKNNNSQNPAINSLLPKAGYEKALAASLGDDLDANIGNIGDKKWQGSAISQIDWHKENLGDFEVLADVVSGPNELLPRLKAIAIVGDEVFAKTNSLSIGLRIVTKSGDLKRWDGYVKTRNATHPSQIRLEQLNRQRAINDELRQFEDTLKQSAQILADARSTTSAKREAIKIARNIVPQKLSLLNQTREKLNRLEAEKKRFEDSLASLKSSLNNVSENLARAKENLEQFNSQDAQIDKEAIDKAQATANLANDNAIKARQELGEAQANLKSIEANIKSRNDQFENLKSQKQQWENRIQNAANRLKALAQDEANEQKSLNELANKPQEIEALRQKSLNELPNIETRKKNADDEIAKIESLLREKNGNVRLHEQNLGAAREAANTADIMQRTWGDRIAEFNETVATSFNFTPNELESKTKSAINNFDNLTLETAQKRLTRALADREDLGGVNLTADSELIEVSSKSENLAKERDELLAAITKLRKAIDEINAEGREKLIAAFEVVNNHFIQLFTTLFDGGTAHLALSETDDPLGGGLEVYACPPGKRLQSMSLMSGGEQALTATALIFAVFLSNPAPISVLDEIDAPLDDANVDRFCRLMIEMVKRTETRFIVITHHPITMARMDRLFGVTMAERGVSQVVAVDLSRAESMINAQ